MKIGIYGGAFNPPHVGHILAAEAFFKEMSLDKLIIMPTGTAPHKSITGDTTPRERVDFCIAAFPQYEVSDYEVAKGGVSYSVDTLKAFKSIYPGDEIYFLCGYDMIEMFEKWYKFEEIFGLATVVAMNRSEYTGERLCKITRKLEEKYGVHIPILSFKPIDISSTTVRGLLKKGESTKGMITDEVANLIAKYGCFKGK